MQKLQIILQLGLKQKIRPSFPDLSKEILNKESYFSWSTSQEEATASLAAAKEISVAATVVVGRSELDGIFTLKEGERAAQKMLSSLKKMCFPFSRLALARV